MPRPKKSAEEKKASRNARLRARRSKTTHADVPLLSKTTHAPDKEAHGSKRAYSEETGHGERKREESDGYAGRLAAAEATLGIGPGVPADSPRRMQAERIARGETLVRDPADPSGIEAWRAWKGAREGHQVTVIGGRDRIGLRASLAALEHAYGRAQAVQDWAECDRINQEREPMFAGLYALEKDLPSAERYWIPARFRDQGPLAPARGLWAGL